jgi:hypothetical protein
MTQDQQLRHCIAALQGCVAVLHPCSTAQQLSPDDRPSPKALHTQSLDLIDSETLVLLER